MEAVVPKVLSLFKEEGMAKIYLPYLAVEENFPKSFPSRLPLIPYWIKLDHMAYSWPQLAEKEVEKVGKSMSWPEQSSFIT